ncbi:hypothetical protein ES705_11200 [subsurface metagenome]
MNLIRKKSIIFPLIVIFTIVVCFTFLALPKKLFADTGEYKEYWEYWEEGTDTGAIPGYDSGTFSEYTDWYQNNWYIYGTYTFNIEMDVQEDLSYYFYFEESFEGNIDGINKDDCGRYDYSNSGHDNYIYTIDDIEYSVDCDWSRIGWYEIKWPEPKPRRIHDLTCYQVNITKDNKFELIFWYEYSNNNWVRIYDTNEKIVYQIDFPYGQPVVIVDLPDGMYKVEVFHEEGKILQEFIIGKS